MKPDHHHIYCFIGVLAIYILAPLATAKAADVQDWTKIYTAAENLILQNLDQNIQNPKITLKELTSASAFPACKGPTDMSLVKTTSRTNVSVKVRCESPVWQVYIIGQIQGNLPVLISATTLSRLQTLSEDQVTLTQMPLSKVPREFYSHKADVLGLRMKVNLGPKRILRPNHLLPALWARKDQPIAISTQEGSIKITLNGIALKDGVQGERIPVRNLSSNRILYGHLQAPNLVVIE